MYVRFLVLFLITSNAFAEELKVNYGLYNYSLDITPEKLRMTGKELDLSLSKNKCNEKIFESFSKNTLHAIDKLEIRKTQRKENVQINFKKKETSYSPKSPQGRYFLGLVDEFKKAKIQDKLKCKK